MSIGLYSPAEVSALRREMTNYGIRLDAPTASKLLRHVTDGGGTRDVCVDALLQEKRPLWLEGIVGPVGKKT